MMRAKLATIKWQYEDQLPEELANEETFRLTFSLGLI